MDNTGQAEGGVNVNTTYRDNADASMDITTRDHADGSMGITSRGNASASMGIPTKGSVCDEQCAPRRVPSLAELPDNSQLTMGEQTAPLRLSGGGGLRRMSSTPAMFSRAVPMSESSNGTTLNYSHPAAISQTSSAGDAPVRDEVAEFLQIIKLMILEAVQVKRYKNGLFVTSITPRTDLVSDLNILCNSTQVMGLDNMRLCNVRADVEAIKRKLAANQPILKTVMGQKLTMRLLYGHNLTELRDVLLSTDKIEHARWLQYYGGGSDNNNGDNNGAVTNN